MIISIIPTFNRAQFLREAIDSALNQDVEDIKIIVVDDGSTDNTPDLIGSYVAKYGEDKIRYLKQENKGPSAARNLGIRN